MNSKNKVGAFASINRLRVQRDSAFHFHTPTFNQKRKRTEEEKEEGREKEEEKEMGDTKEEEVNLYGTDVVLTSHLVNHAHSVHYAILGTSTKASQQIFIFSIQRCNQVGFRS